MQSNFDQDWLNREFGGGSEQQTPQAPNDAQNDRDWLDREFGQGVPFNITAPTSASFAMESPVRIGPPSFWNMRDNPEVTTWRNWLDRGGQAQVPVEFLDSGYRAPSYSPFPLQGNQWQTGMRPESQFNIADQMAMTYPGFKREGLPDIRQIQMFMPSGELGMGERGMYTPPGESDYPQGSIHLYGRDPAVALHEYGHAESVPQMDQGQWDAWSAAVENYLQKQDPEYWRMQTELRYGYGSTKPEEAYAEVARLAGGNLANIPPELRGWYAGWLSEAPQQTGIIAPRQVGIAAPTWQTAPTRQALDLLNMTPQQVEHVRTGLQNVERRGYSPTATRDYIATAQRVLLNTDPRVVEAYGGWPRWLPRPRSR